MPTLVRIRGLDRGESAVGADVASGRGFRLPHALLKARDGGTGVVRAGLDVGAGNSMVRYTAKYGGATWNGVQVQHVDPASTSTPTSVAVTYGADGLPDIIVTLGVDGASAINVNADNVIAAVNAHPEAAQFVTASRGTGNGTGLAAAVALTNLAGGANGTGSTERAVSFKANSKATVVVDLDDPMTMKLLKRNAGRFISLGQL